MDTPNQNMITLGLFVIYMISNVTRIIIGMRTCVYSKYKSVQLLTTWPLLRVRCKTKQYKIS